MNLEQARTNMVEQQIRTWEVLDQDVLDLLYVVPREEFVPAEHRALAFSDMEIPIGEGERMWQPKME
ncbi:MAG: protein-L-isoaspartate O-methyltransferase family protein, partial [Burkholderiales bacterium]